jgi:hypothetical protein
MICPHCDAETPATMPYCQSCGQTVDLTFEKVQETFSAEAETKALRETADLARGLLYSAIVAFVVVLVARAALLREAPRPAVLPAYAVDEPADPDAKGPVPPLPVEVPPIPIPEPK